ncbi:MAG: site-specific integrase [Prevotella sp.]|jgi:site-specific recombinase XerD|nr:site-specific integrase [Prevotella sp.]
MATISVICYKSKTLSNGEYPLVIRITKDGNRSYKYLGISVETQHWDFKKNEPKPNCPNRDHILKIIQDKKAEYQTQVLEFKTSHKNFTASSLIKTTEQTTVAKTVDAFYRELIAHYRKLGKIGNSNIYRDSYNSMKRFRKVDRLDFLFSEIDLAYLNEYEKWMVSIGKAETSMSLLFRTLRSAFNKAIEQNLVRSEDYPFKNFKMSKFSTKTKKRAISKEDIIKILELDLSGEKEVIQLSRDVFIFSYLQGGINFTDIASLTADNMVNGRLEYTRKKTNTLINVPLQQESIRLIHKYNDDKRGYLFPILNKQSHKTPMQKFSRIQKKIKQINYSLKQIAKIAGIEINLTTYVARHSFATVLKRSGVNTSIISESLGHSSESVTQIYLDSFENSQIDEAMENLL